MTHKSLTTLLTNNATLKRVSSANDEHLTPHSAIPLKKPKPLDKVPAILNALASGMRLKDDKLNFVIGHLHRYENLDGLVNFTEKVFSITDQYSWKGRLLKFVVNNRYTYFGVAPAWRLYPFLEINEAEEVGSIDPMWQSDIRIIDLQWLHSKCRDSDAWKHSTSGLYQELMSKESFDYVLAQKLAISCTDRIKAIDELGLSEDIQRELAAFKTVEIEQERQKITRLRVEVEKDLRIAAHRNPNMGNKLIAVLPDRLDLWMSTRVAPSDSKSVLHETYKKITGSNNTLSTYNSKYQSLKKALICAKSQFIFN